MCFRVAEGVLAQNPLLYEHKYPFAGGADSKIGGLLPFDLAYPWAVMVCNVF
jgi:hypothetical protein